MIALQVEDVKNFMNKLFKDVTFDEFEVVSVDLQQGISYTIDGALQLQFYDSLEKELLNDQKYIKWSELKGTVFSIIKGNKTPSTMKIVFVVSQKSKLNLVNKSSSVYQPEDVNGFYLNIIFDASGLKIVTGINYKLFSLDKSIENYYDDSILRFFSKNDILIIS
ncbi:MAG: hypothetical protein CVV02_17735 [Firmicutes bacterium HGW-Firmicutes-7]|nr:MAG: hypothetical protein CVV02_17735 [Firmicutes bacterium HGW-Firmicutes-7]